MAASTTRRDEEREKAIVADYNSDMGIAAIQSKYEISPGQLYRILDKFGVKPRRAPGIRPAAEPQKERTDRPKEEKPKDVIAEAVREYNRRPPKIDVEKVAVAAIEAALEPVEEDPVVPGYRPPAVEAKVEPTSPVTVEPTQGPGYVFIATVEYRVRNTVRLTASSIVDAAMQARAITSPNGEPAEVVMLSREG